MIREKTGVRYVFGFNSGREAIQAALLAKGIGVGDHVVMPSYCCESVARAVTSTGAQPLFCDIDNDYNPDVDDIVKKVNSSVKAIIFPHLFGNPGAIDRLERELEKKGIRSKIFLVDDAAQSFGAELKGRLVGTFGDAGIISFGPGKTMTASGGGLLLTNSEDLADKLATMELNTMSFNNKLRRLAYWVIFRRWRRFTLPLLPIFSRFLGIIERSDNRLLVLCNIDASIGLEQLKKLDILLQIRIERKKRLDQHLSSTWKGQITLPPPNENREKYLNVATKYVFRFRNNSDEGEVQDRFRVFFISAGIELQNLYRPIHLGLGGTWHGDILERTERVWKTVLQIPLEPSISQGQFKSIIRTFEEIKECLINAES
jgi:dTDP-4-amino-4,6-dideoxygalactose transaminase